MDSIFHYGAETERYIQDFEGKWADYALQTIANWTAKDLSTLFFMLEQEKRTIAK